MSQHPLLVARVFPHDHQEEGCKEEVAQNVYYKCKSCPVEDQRDDPIDIGGKSFVNLH